MISPIGLPSPDALGKFLARTATGADVAFMVDLARRDTEALGFMPRQAVLESVDRGQGLVVTDGSEVVGFALTSQHGKYAGVIVQAAVIRDCRRAGAGSVLAFTARRRLGERGCAVAGLSCRKSLVGALSFWEAAGFARIGSIAPNSTRGLPLEVYRATTLDPRQPQLLDLRDFTPRPAFTYASKSAGRLAKRSPRVDTRETSVLF
jgi:ribosomal protein S18 acetylase RimI-like enzyme